MECWEVNLAWGLLAAILQSRGERLPEKVTIQRKPEEHSPYHVVWIMHPAAPNVLSDLLSWRFQILNKFLFGLCQFGLVTRYSQMETCWFPEEKELTLAADFRMANWRRESPGWIKLGEAKKGRQSKPRAQCTGERLEGKTWAAQTPLRRAPTSFPNSPLANSSCILVQSDQYLVFMEAMFLSSRRLQMCPLMAWCFIGSSWKIVSSWPIG